VVVGGEKRAVWFPSPQGGSETETLEEDVVTEEGFHPLKAGRRPARLAEGKGVSPVSIPSRRVGDIAGRWGYIAA